MSISSTVEKETNDKTMKLLSQENEQTFIQETPPKKIELITNDGFPAKMDSGGKQYAYINDTTIREETDTDDSLLFVKKQF